MIYCSTEIERTALARLVWAVQAIVSRKKSSNPEIVELNEAFEDLFQSDGGAVGKSFLPRLVQTRKGS